MKYSKSIFLATFWMFALSISDADAFTVGKIINGYQCMSLNLSPEQQFNGPLPPVFAAPTEASSQVGTTGGVVYVAWPINEINGFVEMIRYNGKRAWISASVLTPYRFATGPAASCVLYMNERGLIIHKDREIR